MMMMLYRSYNMYHIPDCPAGILEIRTVSEGGILAIKGVKSQYYISMNKAGQLQGKVTFSHGERSHVLIHNHAEAKQTVQSVHLIILMAECVSITEDLQRQLQL